MSRLRWALLTFGLPMVYLVALCVSTRPEKPEYVLPGRTVMTVTDKGGPAILHAPEAIYPPQALRDGVEGSVVVNVTIAADGTVTNAVPVSGPEPLRQAAVDNVRQWQFAAKAQETPIDVVFSLRSATRSLTLPDPVRRIAPAGQGSAQGSVRVVAMVDEEGRVEFAHPVTGPEALRTAAVEAVRQWTFHPKLRNGKAEHGTVVVDVPFGS